jgi:hypothetical protein
MAFEEKQLSLGSEEPLQKRIIKLYINGFIAHIVRDNSSCKYCCRFDFARTKEKGLGVWSIDGESPLERTQNPQYCSARLYFRDDLFTRVVLDCHFCFHFASFTNGLWDKR